MGEEVLIVILVVKAAVYQQVTHEEGHEAYSPDPSKPCRELSDHSLQFKKLTIGSEHVAQFSDEVLRCLLTGNILRPGLFPSDNKLFGFGETSPDNSGEQRETSTEEIDCSPVILASLNDSQINDCEMVSQLNE